MFWCETSSRDFLEFCQVNNVPIFWFNPELHSILRNVFKPDQYVSREFWDANSVLDEIYVTTESMIDLVLEMEQFNERINEQESSHQSSNSSALTTFLHTMLILALFAVI